MMDELYFPDMGGGMYQNPVLFCDYSDPDVIRVGDTYYMTASSFNYVPGLPILVSKDLVNWELVNYALELWCWRRLLRVPWTARRSNQSILKEISPECSLEGLMLKLKLPYFGHLIQRADSLEKTLMLGKIEGKRRRVQQRMRWLDGITDSMDMNLSNSGSW